MDCIKWRDNYTVNIAEIDEQHKKLIGMVNEMANAMSVGKGRDVVGSVLKALVEYTVYHFQTEERYFIQYDYPEYEKHKKIHDDLTAKAVELKRTFDEGKQMITVEVMHFLSNWLNTHILEEDKKFGVFLNAKKAA